MPAGLATVPAVGAQGGLSGTLPKLGKIKSYLRDMHDDVTLHHGTGDPGNIYNHYRDRIRTYKVELATDNFPHVYGHAFGFWFQKLECIDLKLDAATAPFGPRYPGEEARRQLLNEAWDCADSVEQALRKVPGIEQSAFTKLNSIKTRLRNQEIGNPKDPLIKRFKLLLLARNFPSMYGDTAREWFAPLECIDEQIQGIGTELGSVRRDNGDSYFPTKDDFHEAGKRVEKAQDCLHEVAVMVRTALKSTPSQFRITGTLHMSWQWPPDQHGMRQSDSFDVTSATACGKDPSHLIWQVSTSDGPTSAPFGASNPALVTTHTYGTAAKVSGFLHYIPGSDETPDKISLEATKQGDVVGPTIDPSSTEVTSSPVAHC